MNYKFKHFNYNFRQFLSWLKKSSKKLRVQNFHWYLNYFQHFYFIFKSKLFIVQFCTGDEEPVAIIGMACRLPGANTVDEFWSLLINKENKIRPIGSDRWTSEQSCVLDSDSGAREVGFLKCPIDQFDSQFFGMSPMELTYTDPQQRLLLEVC